MPLIFNEPSIADELSALRLANKDLKNWFDAVKSDHDILADKVLEQRKLITLALMSLECQRGKTASDEVIQWVIETLNKGLK